MEAKGDAEPMCGIAGVYASGASSASAHLLQCMAGELEHRGPDGVGLYLDGRFGMTSTRLSVIDVAGGDQPLSNEDGRLWVMQNGEIFNHPELREELRGRGHRFTTQSDTEVIVHAFEEWGARCLEHINGEFAFAVYDRATGSVFLARDAFGIRPLFLAEFGGDMAFASEAKALLRHPAADRRVDPYGLVETFTLWAVLPDRSAFAGIRELPPGHHVTITANGIGTPERWWDIHFGPREGTRHESPADLAEELSALLDEATRLRLRADVPVGVYLSGGLDSSAIAVLARRHSRELQAFSIGFEDADFDESDHQERMARELDIPLQRITVSGHDVAESFPEVVRMAEKPMLRTAPGPLLRLSRTVREAGFKVVLTGEGADEVFGGYAIFQEAMVRRFWARRPDSKIRPALLAKLYPFLSRDLRAGDEFVIAFFRHGLEDVDDPLYSHRPRFRTSARNLRFLHPDVRAGTAHLGRPEDRLLASLPATFGDSGPLGQAQYLEIRTFMCGYLLHSQGDRMLMANSVEGRFPFLDVNVAAFAASLPERLRLRDLADKYLLRSAAVDVLPEDIRRRPKRPYRAPILRAFFGVDAPSYLDDMLDPAHIAAVGLFSAPLVQRLVEKCRRSVETGSSEGDEMALVGILSTMLLHEQLVARPRLAPPATPTRMVVGDTDVSHAAARAEA